MLVILNSFLPHEYITKLKEAKRSAPPDRNVSTSCEKRSYITYNVHGTLWPSQFKTGQTSGLVLAESVKVHDEDGIHVCKAKKQSGLKYKILISL